MPLDSNDSLRPGELRVQLHASAGRHTICLEGELDMASAPQLAATVNGLASEAREIILDIDQVSFIDSSGLGAILATHKQCERAGAGFALTHGSEQARRLFEIAGLLDQLPFVDPPNPS